MNRTFVFLMRHGEAGLDQVKRYIGRLDVPLTDTGKAQAEAWARRFSAVPLGRIVASDLQRARDTARIIAEAKQLEVQVVPDLREIDLGSWEGMSIEEIKTRQADDHALRGRNLAGYRSPEGESFSDVQKRVMRAFNRLVEEQEENLLIVGHAGTNRVILCALLGMPLDNLFRLGQDYGTLTTIEVRDRSYRILSINAGPGEVLSDR